VLANTRSIASIACKHVRAQLASRLGRMLRP
jgi:hypothetical protein